MFDILNVLLGTTALLLGVRTVRKVARLERRVEEDARVLTVVQNSLKRFMP